MLRDVVEHMASITGFVEAAMLLFFSVFVSVLVREGLRSKGEVKRMADLPLADDADNGGAQ